MLSVAGSDVDPDHPTMPRTTSSQWAMGIVRSLEMDGLDGRALFQDVGLESADLDNPDARFPQDALTRLWLRAAERSNNSAIGLNLARAVRPASFGAAGYVVMSSRTLREGFERLVRYQRIIADSTDLSLRLQPEGYALTLVVHGDLLRPCRHSAESALASILAFSTWLMGRPLHPRQVLIKGDVPRTLEPYQRFFHAPLLFNAPQDALVFDGADLEAPLPTADAAMAQLHERHAEQLLGQFSANRTAYQVRQVLCRMLPRGEPRREAVAKSLHLSQRTLQRRLEGEGTSFQMLLDDTRRELAVQFLNQPHVTLLEIAYQLGFTDSSNFFRAFRRWFNETPSEYRIRNAIG